MRIRISSAYSSIADYGPNSVRTRSKFAESTVDSFRIACQYVRYMDINLNVELCHDDDDHEVMEVVMILLEHTVFLYTYLHAILH